MKLSLKKNPRRALGIGLGLGMAGTLALAFRYGLRRLPRRPIPEDHSPAIFARRLATTNCGEMVYHISGAGEPVVFLHGMYPGASSFEWSRVYPSFVLHREVIAADLIGFGESERPATHMSASDYAQSLADFLAEVSPGRPPVVVASGLTASLALLAASRHPERLRSLALFMPMIPRAVAPWASRRLSLSARIPPLAGWLYDLSIARDPFLNAWAARFGFVDPARQDPEVIRNLAVCAQQSGARHALLNVLQGGLRFDLIPRLPSIPHPVILLNPESAPGFRSEDVDTLAQHLPAAATVPLPRCAALSALESPALLESALEPLLRGPTTNSKLA